MLNRDEVLKISVAGLVLVLFAAGLPTTLSAMTGVCVDAPGIPCNGSYSGGGGYNVDPGYRAMIREQKRLEREERERKQEARRRYRTPYRGFEKLQKRVRLEIREDLKRLGQSTTTVSYSNARVSADQATIFVPDHELSSILMVRPINPVAQETKISSKQLRKVRAVLSEINANNLSFEEGHFLATQAAAIMTGGQSYVHVTLGETTAKEPMGTVERINNDLTALTAERIAIAQIDKEMDSVLAQTKDEIQTYVALRQKLREASKAEKAELSRQLQQSEAKMNAYEESYFNLHSKQELIRVKAQNIASEMKDTIIWKK